MDLFRVETFESDELGRLPEQKVLIEKTLAMAKNLEALRERSDYGAVQRAGDFERTGERGVLPRGAGAPAGRAAAAGRRGRADVYQAAEQADPAELYFGGRRSDDQEL